VAVEEKIEETAPQIKTVRAEGEWKGRYRTDLNIRDFRFIVAEPEKIGGKNEGPTPMEYVLGALNGCLSAVVEALKVRKKSGAQQTTSGCSHAAKIGSATSVLRSKTAISCELSPQLMQLRAEKALQKRS